MSAEESVALATGEQGGDDAVLFTVGGSSFPCVSWVPQWNVMRLAAAMDSGDEMRAMAQMYRFVLSMVRPEAHEALEAHLSTLDLERSDLDNAIGDALVEMAGRGKGSGVPRGIPKNGESSGSSSDGSTETAPTRRVVSLSRGTVQESALADAKHSSTD